MGHSAIAMFERRVAGPRRTTVADCGAPVMHMGAGLR